MIPIQTESVWRGITKFYSPICGCKNNEETLHEKVFIVGFLGLR